MPIAWLFFGYCAIVLVGLPIIIGTVSRTWLRAVLFSVVCAAAAPTLYLGTSLYRFGVRGLPDAGAVLLFGSAIMAAIVGWLAHRISRFYRQQPLLAPTWSALRFLSLTAIKLVLLYVVIDGLWILVAVAFADEVPWIMYLRLHWWHYAYLGAAVVLVLAWSVIAIRRGKMPNPLARASLEVLPAAAFALLFMAIALAYPQLRDWTPLLDCSPRGIPGYVPHMIDYGRFVLGSLTTGVRRVCFRSDEQLGHGVRLRSSPRASRAAGAHCVPLQVVAHRPTRGSLTLCLRVQGLP